MVLRLGKNTGLLQFEVRTGENQGDCKCSLVDSIVCNRKVIRSGELVNHVRSCCAALGIVQYTGNDFRYLGILDPAILTGNPSCHIGS